MTPGPPGRADIVVLYEDREHPGSFGNALIQAGKDVILAFLVHLNILSKSYSIFQNTKFGDFCINTPFEKYVPRLMQGNKAIIGTRGSKYWRVLYVDSTDLAEFARLKTSLDLFS